MSTASSSTVRHLVLCGFKEGTSAEQLRVFVDAFRAITTRIPGVQGFEWGENNSPENLNRGLTCAFQLSFESAQARDAYLPHPEHQRFVAEQGGILDQVLVLDYAPES